jgi:hypothetical protein
MSQFRAPVGQKAFSEVELSRASIKRSNRLNFEGLGHLLLGMLDGMDDDGG